MGFWMLKTPQIGVEARENMEGASLRFPWRSLMKGDLELTSRVRARMVKAEGIAEDFRSALMMDRERKRWCQEDHHER